MVNSEVQADFAQVTPYNVHIGVQSPQITHPTDELLEHEDDSHHDRRYYSPQTPKLDSNKVRDDPVELGDVRKLSKDGGKSTPS